MSWLITAPRTLIGLVILALLSAGMKPGFRGHGWLQRRSGGAAGKPPRVRSCGSADDAAPAGGARHDDDFRS